jgi:integration host factor subunit alpha
MTLTKEDLVKGVVENVRLKRPRRERQRFLFPEFNYEPLPKKRAARAVDTIFEIMKKSLEKGDSVLISGFGKFIVKFRWARKGRNPRTGEQIILESRRVVTFHCAPRLKEKIRAND